MDSSDNNIIMFYQYKHLIFGCELSFENSHLIVQVPKCAHFKIIWDVEKVFCHCFLVDTHPFAQKRLLN